ncbi:ABC1 kinase family protein [Propionicicella superfundia]|uniref:ABC1 kinase family protein n=1 Tax=Propionicicella superfundia TaxID=348582 RepID=UPI00041376CF|nr:AarF/ABC1/UbiB kinase family protein [Propionicicella superfundia]
MSDPLPPEQERLSRTALGRGARLLQIPLGEAGRRAVGWGRRLTGADPDEVAADNAERMARQLFQVLGELKGGAMKVGQVLSLMEAALPEEHAQPMREHLRKLQDSAPPMPASKVQGVLRSELGPSWGSLFTEFSMRPAAAASIGQVHRAVWAETQTPVAVKIQYPGAEEALLADLAALRRMASTVAPLAGGVDVAALAREVSERVSEEVDYTLEADAQERVAAAFAEHPEFLIPRVRRATRRVIVSDWVDGDRLGAIADRPPAERNRIGLSYVRFLFAGPKLAGILHADPHPGNYLVCPDGRLAVLDFGLVARVPDGLPPAMGRLVSLARDGRADEVATGLAAEGFVTADLAPEELLDYLAPFFEPAAVPEFHFTRQWMQDQFARVRDIDGSDGIALKLTVPPVYALIYRVWMGGIAVLAQLDVSARFADVLQEFLPGWRPAP